MSHKELLEIEGGVLLLNADDIDSLASEIERVKSKLFSSSFSNFDTDPAGHRLSAVLSDLSSDFEAKGTRCGIVATNWEQLAKRMDLLGENLSDSSKWGFLAKQMVFITEEEALPPNAKLVQMYPGQGSQYVGMTLDLSKRFEVIGETWDEADSTMSEILAGETLSEFVLRDNLTEKQAKDAEDKLKQTEFTQPAMLTADLAIYRLLSEHGINPDMVAGHSLGEYAALMVSGIMKFHDALRAAAARGTEMGNVEVKDKGLMGSVTAPLERIQDVIDSVDGYIIAANKNSPMMAVIAGETEPMQDAISRFGELNIPCVTLQTSHAFHSRIVAPANEPLHRFLEGLDLSLPSIPITANYDGKFYPESLKDGETVHDAILNQLAPQMSSAVEWTQQIEEMYSQGGRLFIEVGPKRALALFTEQILDGKSKVVSNTNHPKVGGVASFLSSLTVCALSGRLPSMQSSDSNRLTEGFRAGPLEAWQQNGIVNDDSINSEEMEELRVRSRPLPSGSSNGEMPAPSQIIQSQEIAIVGGHHVVQQVVDKEGYLASRISDITGYPARLIKGELHLSALGISDETLPELLASIASEASVSGPADASQLTTLVALN